MKGGNDADLSMHVVQMAHQESPQLRYGVITDALSLRDDILVSLATPAGHAFHNGDQAKQPRQPVSMLM
jgi:hypothetical protein